MKKNVLIAFLILTTQIDAMPKRDHTMTAQNEAPCYYMQGSCLTQE